MQRTEENAVFALSTYATKMSIRPAASVVMLVWPLNNGGWRIFRTGRTLEGISLARQGAIMSSSVSASVQPILMSVMFSQVAF